MTSVIRWGILGTAHIGRSLLRAIGDARDNCIQAVASREWTRASEWAREFGVPRVFGSYDELLTSGEVNAIYNPLPNSLHGEWTIRALEAGLPVLCEKPFTTTAEEARKVAAVAARTQLPVAEAFMYRYHPMYERVLQAVRGGEIGQVMAIRSAFTFRLPDRTNIRWSKELAGGSLMDIGCYCVNVSRLIAGTEPVRVAAIERREGVDGTMIGVLEFPNGLLSRFECSFEQYDRSYVEIEGSEGIVTIPKPWFPGEDFATYSIKRGEHEEVVRVPGANTYLLEIEDFGNACRTHASTRWPVDDAIANMAVLDSLYQAAVHGRRVEIG